MGIVARAAGAGAVVASFALGANSLSDAPPAFQTASLSRPVPADLCTDNPADPSCPPTNPIDPRCQLPQWRLAPVCDNNSTPAPPVRNLCTVNPADPSCPPTGPNDVKCAGAWHGTAAGAGGPFDRTNTINCNPALPGCPGTIPASPL